MILSNRKLARIFRNDWLKPFKGSTNHLIIFPNSIITNVVLAQSHHLLQTVRRTAGRKKSLSSLLPSGRRDERQPPPRYHASLSPRKFGGTFHGSTRPLCSQFGRFPCFMSCTVRRSSEGRFPLAAFYSRVSERRIIPDQKGKPENFGGQAGQCF